MKKFPGSIRVKVTHPLLPDWYATSLMLAETPQKTVTQLNLQAARKNTGAHYELATEEAYQAYRKKM
jgi:hypothetical protein